MNAPYLDCPRYNKCSVNNCPLHPGYPNLYTDPEDPQTKCTLSKVYRTKIAENYPGILPMGGRKVREFASEQAWANMSQGEQAERTQRLKEIGFTCASQTEQSEVIAKEGAV